MSQPLTGLVRRRLQDLTVHEGWFLMALADMADSVTREWREPWHRLALRLGHRNKWCIKRIAYRLRDHHWLSVKSDGRGVVITLHPERGKPTPFCSLQVANPVSHQVAKPVSQQVANGIGSQVANRVSSIDIPPHTPPGANAPDRPSSSADPKGHVCANIDNGDGSARAHTPASPGGKKQMPAIFQVPAFDPLDARMVPRLRERHAERVLAILEARLESIRSHLESHPEDRDPAAPAWSAIRTHIKAVKAWAAGVQMNPPGSPHDSPQRARP